MILYIDAPGAARGGVLDALDAALDDVGALVVRALLDEHGVLAVLALPSFFRRAMYRPTVYRP